MFVKTTNAGLHQWNAELRGIHNAVTGIFIVLPTETELMVGHVCPSNFRKCLVMANRNRMGFFWKSGRAYG